MIIEPFSYNISMKSKLTIIQQEIKQILLLYCSPIKFISIGSNKNEITFDTDIDIVIIVDNNIETYRLLKLISPAITEIIKRHNILIGIYPIHLKEYEQNSTQFICNIIKNGIEF